MQASAPRFPLRTLSLALCAALPLLAEAAVAGRFQFVLGDVRIVGLNGQERPAQKGQEILEGETLRTGANASAQVKMIDGGLIAMRPESQIKLEAYDARGIEQGKEKAVISLAKGGFRTVTGLIGKSNKESYSVTTPTATIGIRGTDHTPVVVAPPLPGAPAADPPGTYDKVTVGATSLTTPAGTALIQKNQVGFANSPTQAPVVLPKPPAFYQQATPPASKQEAPKTPAQGNGAGSGSATSSGGSSGSSSSTRAGSGETGSTTSSSESSSSSSGTAATTTTGTASATSDAGDMRLSAPLDSTQLNTPSTTTATTTPPSVVVQPLTGTGSNGATLNTASATGSVAVRNYVPGLAAILTYGSERFSAHGDGLTLTRDASNLPSKFYYNSQSNQYTYTGSGSTAADVGQDSATGLSWGRFAGGQVSKTYSANYGTASTTTTSLGSSSLHWLSGPQAYPDFLPKVLTGSATYSYIGGTRPTDSNGNIGTLSSATLSANFTAQTVNAGVGLTIASNTWNLQFNGLPIKWGSAFDTSLCSSGCTNPSSYTFTKNGSAAISSASANLSGQFMGSGLNAAGFEYTITDTSSGTNHIQGVAAFSGPSQSIPLYRVGYASNGFDFALNSGVSSPTYTSGFVGAIDFSAAPDSRVVLGASGLTEFVGQALYVKTGDPASTFTRDDLITAKIGTATNQDFGSTTINTLTISWGRWSGGTVDIYSQDGATKIGTIDNTSKNFHWVVSPALTSMPTGSLPLTGTVTYNLAGGTNPTDLLGNVGKLDSITLNADFGAMRANTKVAASFNGSGNSATWTMTANNVPISASGDIYSHSGLNGANSITHTTTCSGTGCGSQTHSSMGGTFIGTGAAGAVVSYRMVTGNSGGTTYTGLPSNFTPTNAVMGVAVLKK